MGGMIQSVSIKFLTKICHRVSILK